MDDNIDSIAFLGTGLMGAPMARNLMHSGFHVTAWNRTRDKAEALYDMGAVVADTAPDAVASADVTITMLSDGGVVEEVLREHKVFEAMQKGSVLIDMSSIKPQTAQKHSRVAEKFGVDYLDAPVSGGTRSAENSTLSIMCGGKQEVFDKVKRVFEAMGTPTRIGPAGTGQLAKLCNQSVVATTIGAVAEALLLAKAGGADLEAVREALLGGFAESRILREHGQRMLARDFESGGPVKHQVKDLEAILEVASDCHLHLPGVETVTDLFRHLSYSDPDMDHSGVLIELERRNGIYED